MAILSLGATKLENLADTRVRNTRQRKTQNDMSLEEWALEKCVARCVSRGWFSDFQKSNPAETGVKRKISVGGSSLEEASVDMEDRNPSPVADEHEREPTMSPSADLGSVCSEDDILADLEDRHGNDPEYARILDRIKAGKTILQRQGTEHQESIRESARLRQNVDTAREELRDLAALREEHRKDLAAIKETLAQHETLLSRTETHRSEAKTTFEDLAAQISLKSKELNDLDGRSQKFRQDIMDQQRVFDERENISLEKESQFRDILQTIIQEEGKLKKLGTLVEQKNAEIEQKHNTLNILNQQVLELQRHSEEEKRKAKELWGRLRYEASRMQARGQVWWQQIQLVGEKVLEDGVLEQSMTESRTACTDMKDSLDAFDQLVRGVRDFSLQD
ncbi:hypothetical protein N431DRAFT_456043 [Stipitochalara longipes BDJ]|nr:hypothetical protein N431DRAFT_456043 [Stipitochalara longipes BDJ]